MFHQTFYVIDDSGEQIKHLAIEGVSGQVGFSEHFKLYRRPLINDVEKKAYIIFHGLCSYRHDKVVLKFSAPDYNSTEQLLDFGPTRAYVINLKRKGSKEKATIFEITCNKQPDRCLELPSN